MNRFIAFSRFISKAFLTELLVNVKRLSKEIRSVERSGGRCAPMFLKQMTKAESDKLDEDVTKLYGNNKPTTHLANFFNCIRTGTQPVSDVYSHHRCASNCHIGNIAMKLGRRLQWDPKGKSFSTTKKRMRCARG
ncbi:MAG TPA: hypothetical protein VM260_11675 [Pirellula sp.]|nr:hypothetical protein [Pirellula sp.]